MRLTDGISDAIDLTRDLHRKVQELEKIADEIQYLIYSLDDRAKIEFFGGVHDCKGASKEGTKAD